MTVGERYEAVLRHFAATMPDADTELVFRDDYELLVAVMLSAQCTDKRVNMVTPSLFVRWPDVASLSTATEEEVREVISSISYPNSKSRHLVGMARKVVEEFGGRIPHSRDELMLLPGVGRKTANVMLIVAYGVPAMPVDTHVFRVAARLGLSKGSKTPEQTERQLVAHIPAELLHKAHHWLILFGRYTCTANRPRCAVCGLREVCVTMAATEKERNGAKMGR